MNTTLDLIAYGIGASGWLVAALLGLKLKGKAPPDAKGLGKDR